MCWNGKIMEISHHLHSNSCNSVDSIKLYSKCSLSETLKPENGSMFIIGMGKTYCLQANIMEAISPKQTLSSMSTRDYLV